LGAVSFGKELNILDLGDLGSTVMAQIKQPQDRANLLLRIFRPDVVEIHGGWLNDYAAWVNDRRFKEGYDTAEGLWIRREIRRHAGSPERKLIDKLREKLSPAAFRDAIASCNQDAGKDNCLWVVRTAYRFRPDFAPRDRRAVRTLLASIQDPRQRDLALAIFDGAEGAPVAAAVQRYLLLTSD
jgi:hypothetical protein